MFSKLFAYENRILQVAQLHELLLDVRAQVVKIRHIVVSVVA